MFDVGRGTSSATEYKLLTPPQSGDYSEFCQFKNAFASKPYSAYAPWVGVLAGNTQGTVEYLLAAEAEASSTDQQPIGHDADGSEVSIPTTTVALKKCPFNEKADDSGCSVTPHRRGPPLLLLALALAIALLLRPRRR